MFNFNFIHDNTKWSKGLTPSLLFSISKQGGPHVSVHTYSECPHTHIHRWGSHCPLSELPCLYTWMSRTYEPLTAVLLFPALLPVNSNDPASLSLSDIDCFHTFSGFCPQTFFLDFVSRAFLLSQNRQKYSLRSTCWWQFFIGH